MKNRKLLISMLSACFLASCALGVACKKNDGDSVGSSVEESVNTSQILHPEVLQTLMYVPLELWV